MINARRGGDVLVADTRVTGLESLAPVERTLLVPLVARALAHRWHLTGALADASAEHALAQLGWQGLHWMPDPVTMGMILWRTRQFRQWGQAHFERYPTALGVNLGAGLSDYFQWLSNGSNRWLDADLDCVMQVRTQCLPVHEHATCVRLDLCANNWWSSIAAESASSQVPLWILLEGVLIYLSPTQVRDLLHTVADHASTGSCVAFDVIPGWMIGWPVPGPLALHPPAVFQWGLESSHELEQQHPRLHLACVVSWPTRELDTPWESRRGWNPWSPYSLVQLTVS